MIAKINSWILSGIWILSPRILLLTQTNISGSRGSNCVINVCSMPTLRKQQCALACSRADVGFSAAFFCCCCLPLALLLLATFSSFNEFLWLWLLYWCYERLETWERALWLACIMKRLRGKPAHHLVSSCSDLNMAIGINKYR